MTHILDNPVWHALHTGNRTIAREENDINYYQTKISPFVGLKENNEEQLRTLYQQAKDEAIAIVSTRELEFMDNWKVQQVIPVYQMVYQVMKEHKAYDLPLHARALSDQDIPQMLALTQLTKPGPFLERTIDFGHYQGIFEDGQLVAMAGQRMNPTPYAEISAICTHPNYLGRGYARQLMSSQIKRIIETDGIPFLHVATENERAIGIYESMGFEKRSFLYVYILKK